MMSDPGHGPPGGQRGRAFYHPGQDPMASQASDAMLARARRAALQERDALRQQRPLVWPPPAGEGGSRGRKKKRGWFGRRKRRAAEPARAMAPPEVVYEPARAQGPLPAYPNLDARLQASVDVRRGPAAAFTIDGGTVEPLGVKRKRGATFGGGRWRRLVLMTAMMLALSVLLVNGLYRLAGKALYDQPAPPAGSGFPVAAASAYAARFGQAFLTWDDSAPQRRADALLVFFPDARGTDLGWDGVGRQSLLGAPVVAGVTARDDEHAVVHLAAFLVPGGWTCMDVSVFAANGATAFAITSYVAFVACPPTAVAQLADPAGSADVDRDFAEQVRPTVVSFLKAYASSAPELSQSTTEDSGITGLRAVVSFVELEQITTPVMHDPATDSRPADVSVRWQLPSGGTLLQGYRLTLRRIAGRWFIDRIEGGIEDPSVAPKQGGVPPPPTRPPTAASPTATSPTTQPSPASGSPRPTGP
jgi:hypothetical protein